MVGEYVCSEFCAVAAITRLAAISVNSTVWILRLPPLCSTLQAQIARLAGYCYDDFTTLTENVEAEGLQIVACGDTFFTRWYCCKGQITGSVPGDNEFDTLSTVCHIFAILVT